MTILSTHLVGVALIIGCNNIGAEAGFHIADAGAKAVVFADPDAKRASECSTYLNSVMKGKHKRRDYKTTHFAFKNLEKVTVRAIVNDVIAAYGQIDYVVNTIGISMGPRDVENSDMTNCCEVEAAAMLQQADRKFTTKKADRQIGRGVIVNVTPANPGDSFPHYRRAGIAVTTKTALKYKSIRCNLVCPLWVRDETFEKQYNTKSDIWKTIAEEIPCGRAAELDELADTIAFLVSPAASYINAKCLVLDGAREENV